MWAKQSTAATLIVGPILDSAGAEYTSAVIGDLSISKNGGTLTALASAATLTHIANGQYTLVLTTGNLDTLGRAQITCNKSTYQMPEVRLMVLPATVFDALVTNATTAAGGLGDIQRLAGQVITAAAGVTFPASIASPTNITQATGITVATNNDKTGYSLTAGTGLGNQTANITGNLSGSVGSVTGAVALDSTTQAQIDNIETSLTTLGSESTTVERSTSDTNAITFSWPVSGATITGTRSTNNGAYGAVTGAIAFLRSETGKHYYTLAYNSADRPAAEGQVRYKFVDGTYTGYVVLRVEPALTAAQVNAEVVDVLTTDTFAELTAPPAATSSLKDKLTWLFMYARNKVTQTATQRKLYRDDGSTVAGTSGTTDDGTTFTKGEDA